MGSLDELGNNAAVESFFFLLHNNMLTRKRWVTRLELRVAIVSWTERTYPRRQARVGRLTPVEFETMMNTLVSLAPDIPSCHRTV